MGLLSKLNDGGTKLKSLKFGNDRPEGGSSDQPFILSDPAEIIEPNVIDFIFRGGNAAENLSIIDKRRLSNFFDSTQGRLFIQKQELLSKISPATEASVTYGSYNGGIYDKNSTLDQALRLYEGEHLNKQGTFPQNFSTSLITYQQAVITNAKDSSNSYGYNQSNESFENRLLNLWSTKIVKASSFTTTSNIASFGNSTSAANILFQYDGGPDSDSDGTGKTYIRFATLNDGVTPLRTGINNVVDNTGILNSTFQKTLDDYYIKNINGGVTQPLGLSTKFESLFPKYELKIGSKSYELNYGSDGNLDSNSVYASGSLTSREGIKTYQTSRPRNENPSESISLTKIYDAQKATNTDKGLNTISPTTTLTNDGYSKTISDTSVYNTPGSLNPRTDNYRTPTLEQITSRTLVTGQNTLPLYKPKEGKNIGMGDAGAIRGNKKDALDKLDEDAKGNYKDYVNFSVTIINPTAPSTNLGSMRFRSFITSVSDNYTANWKEQSYLGRGEKFYKYSDFGREMNISFKVVALSQAEMVPMYSKLNFLASSIAPTYTTSGYMAGNVARITLGKYILNQYGIIKTLGYTIPEDSSWDIEENRELPLMIDVQMSFTPIHNFRPEPSKQFIAPIK